MLSDLVVLDLTTVVSGATTTAILADFGAHVIKVENPGDGDPLRTWGPITGGVSLWWKVMSRNKRSITLNLRDRRGQALLTSLAAKADLLVENFRPGTMERWDLGYERLSGVNPRLVMLRVSGFGQTGPYRDRPGFGTVAEAMSGYVALSGFPDGPPLLPPMPLADEVTGLMGAVAALMALRHRDRGDGRGQEIDVSLYEPLFRLLIPYVPQYVLTGEVPQRIGNRFAGAAPRNLYRTADGQWVAISATTPRTFERLARVMKRSDLMDDSRFATNESRVAHVEELDRIVQSWVMTRSLEEILPVLAETGVVAGAVYDVQRILRDPHYQARGNVVTVSDPELGQIPMPGVVPTFSRTPGRIVHAGPRLGEYNDEVFAGMLGLSRDEMARLEREGII